jgi:glycosyltransferase involved in cell wall biosynthesis
MSDSETEPGLASPGANFAARDLPRSGAAPMQAATPAKPAFAGSEQPRAAGALFVQWISRRLTLIELLCRPGIERIKLARVFATDLNINQILPDDVLHFLLRRRMLLGLLRRSRAGAASIVDRVVQPLFPVEQILPPTAPRMDKARLDPSRQNVLVVVHDASRTGAPVLGWNIARHLAERYNIFMVTLGGGPLLQDFIELSVETYGPFGYDSINPVTIELALPKLFESHTFKYAIINSAASRNLVGPCAARAIPVVFLLHEFASYVYARDELRAAFDLANEIVFPAMMVADSSLSMHPPLRARQIRILPQGMSILPETGQTRPTTFHPTLRALTAARAEGAIIVLGAGSVEFRKGVDLFLTTAMQVCRHHRNFRFLWVGHGYKPDQDMAYSIYLREQVERAGLQERMIFLDHLPDLEPVYALADIFLLSSRLDPMPNVTIDAAHRGIPIVCFDQASGMADILKSEPMTAGCVVDYLDTGRAADVILALGEDRDGLRQVAIATRRLAACVFDMAKYVDTLDALGSQAAGADMAFEPRPAVHTFAARAP